MKTAIHPETRVATVSLRDLRNELRDPLDAGGNPGRGVLGLSPRLHGRDADDPPQRPDRALRAPARSRRRSLSAPAVQDLRDRVAAEPVARLATLDADGRPHLVPIAFVLGGDTLSTAVDAKPEALAGAPADRERPRAA